MSTAEVIPILLLKTKSTPVDGYEELLSKSRLFNFQPSFIPVLEHRFNEQSLAALQTSIVEGRFKSPFRSGDSVAYRGIIFTSQRAVEAFASVIQRLRHESRIIRDHLPRDLPLYVVGPATARGLRALDLECDVVGEDTGNGDALASFILQHQKCRGGQVGPSAESALLFLVGEQRRDIIPKTLQSDSLSENERIKVDEIVVYETSVMESFPSDFANAIRPKTEEVSCRWVVIFSPTGCKAVLQALGMLDEQSGRVKERHGTQSRITFIATIGPTTRDYLVKEFGFDPNACATKPSPEGLQEAIESFMGYIK
ncbi:MAG: hypothetical protein M1831_005357 [Alyxoria varia]|nr:MAG: hypothetical protein M1831_005357 [Alyxoria varia]